MLFMLNPYSVLRTTGVILSFLKITRFINIMLFIAWITDVIFCFYVKNTKYTQRCKG